MPRAEVTGHAVPTFYRFHGPVGPLVYQLPTGLLLGASLRKKGGSTGRELPTSSALRDS